jgi:multidrug efflux system membrane fusion protein
VAVLLALSAGACQKGAPPVAPAEAPAVPVSQPVARQVTDYVDFTGRTEAKEAVDVRARVTGYLVSIPFREGSEVKGPESPALIAASAVGLLASPNHRGAVLATSGLNHPIYQGDVLFQIDARPYQAQFDQAQGQLNLNLAQLKLAQTTYARDLAIYRSGGAAAISQQQLDQDRAAVDEADARVKSYQASMEVYRLNLNFTKVTAPITGQVSRYYLTPGNLVVQDQTLLTTVVSLDPMYAYFAMDEATLLRIRRAINEGRIKRPQDGVIPVFMGLQGEEGYPHKGAVNFVNNQVDPTTGSISVRGVFPNPRPEGGARLLSPGMFVRIRFPIGQAHPAVLVIDRAISSDQGMKKYVYVVDAQNAVQYRPVTTGALQEDGLRVITEGLKADDWVVVGGLQQVRPRMPVRTDQIPMPSIVTQDSGAKTQESGGSRQKK